jgi:hypothetical protein
MAADMEPGTLLGRYRELRLPGIVPASRRFAPSTIVRLVRAGHLNASVEDCLNPVEDLFADQCLKITTPRHTEFRNVNEASVQPIREHSAEGS